MLFFAGVLVVAAAIVVAYKIQESGMPSVAIHFGRSSTEAAQAANATVHPLDPKIVPKETYNMDAYLDTARSSGFAQEVERLPVETFRAFLMEQTHEAGPILFVLWKDTVIRVEWTGF